MYKKGQEFIGREGNVKKGGEKTIRWVGKPGTGGKLETDREIRPPMIHG